MQALAAEKGVKLDTGKLDACEIDADSEGLRRLLFNLLDNAIKHTPSGGTVTLQLIRQRSSIELTVADTGSGISPDHLPQIFSRFYRGDSVRQSGGTGLGLAISQAIVESHGGRINVQSSVGNGTRVAVEFPMPSPRSQAPGATAANL
jgi:two-component system, OmpR family, sensor histidine kinase BaeS